MLERQAYDILVRKTTQMISLIMGRDVFVLIGRRKSQYEVQYCRQTVSHRMPRYAAMIAPNWPRGATESELRADATLIDPTLTGDPWTPQRMVSCSGGVSSAHLDPSPANAEVRTLDQAYRLAGMVFVEDHQGSFRPMVFAGMRGKFPPFPRVLAVNIVDIPIAHRWIHIQWVGHGCHGQTAPQLACNRRTMPNWGY